MVLPVNHLNFKSEGELDLWKLFQKILPKDWVSFHNYNLSLKEADVILLVPGKGVLIIENKSILSKNIRYVIDNDTIIMRTKDISSPYKQADAYCKILKQYYLTEAHINSVYVQPAVIYPYIIEEEFKEKNLAKIAGREVTILHEDLVDSSAFLNKVYSIFDYAYRDFHDPCLLQDSFSAELLEKTGNLISPNFRDFTEHTSDDQESNESQNLFETSRKIFPSISRNSSAYSKLIYDPDGCFFTEEVLQSLYSEWRCGTKLMLYTSCQDALSKIDHFFTAQIKSADFSISDEQLQLKSGHCFRLEYGFVKDEGQKLTIENGENYQLHEEDLTWLDAKSAFNFGQYEMEHAPETNVIVKAGAGTGKTFSLISRVNYLLWKDHVEPEQFSDFLVMITFTNDSADQMENKLIDNFFHYYQLTKNPKYLDYLEAVSDVHISTIDSLARRILSAYSIKLGLGKDFSIISGNYRRDQILRKNLNQYFEEHPEDETGLPMTMYYLTKHLSELFECFDNKNVNLNLPRLDFGAGTHALNTSLIEVIKKTQAEYDEELKKNNCLCLGDLIRKLQLLSECLDETSLTEHSRIKYLFIDEFQDTDDVQIFLVRSFQKLIGFKYFVVGDAKQSIYRFRGAEEQAFKVLVNNTQSNEYFTLALKKNYRTETSLLEKMNSVFSYMDTQKDLDYRNDDVLVATKPDTTSNSLTLRESPTAEPEPENLIETINEALGQLPENSTARVAILVRYNWQIRTIVEICRNHKIAIDTEQGGALFSVDPTIDLFKLTMALRYNCEPEYLYNLYTTSFVKERLPKESIYNIQPDQILDYFYNENTCPIKKWKSYLELLRSKPVLHVLQEIINDTKPWDVFALKASSNSSDIDRNRSFYIRNLDQLFENILQKSDLEYLTINRLSDYLENMILTQQDEKEREQFGAGSSDVRLLCTTVHKAKGMEYDTVILPYTGFDVSGIRDKGNTNVIYVGNRLGYRISHNSTVQYTNDFYDQMRRDEKEDNLREEMRILYVAMTRAKRKLYCFVPHRLGASAVSWALRLKESHAV